MDLEAREKSLTVQIAEAEETVQANALKADEHARTVDDLVEWFTPVLERLPSDDELARAYRHSRSLARLSHDLYARTGDHRFRRAVDPFDQMRDALIDRLKRLDKIRLSRGGTV
jgi:hypothetical protein